MATSEHRKDFAASGAHTESLHLATAMLRSVVPNTPKPHEKRGGLLSESKRNGERNRRPMKTAEQWNEEYRLICANDPAVHGQLLPNPQNIAFLRRVMRDSAAGARSEMLMVVARALQATCGVRHRRAQRTS